MTNRPLQYLAVPYSHPDPAVMAMRYVKATFAAAQLTASGIPVFSPITHSHPMVPYMPHGSGAWEKWMEIDKAFLSCCNLLIVLTLDGWRESKGVTAEIHIAQEMGIPITFLSEHDVELLVKCRQNEWQEPATTQTSSQPESPSSAV